MILAAGLTPAWQQVLLFDAFTPGEVNRAREAWWCASGKVLNVGIAVRHLASEEEDRSAEIERQRDGETERQRDEGWERPESQQSVPLSLRPSVSPSPSLPSSRTLALVGGMAGKAIRQEFEELGIAARWVETAAATRVCTTILDAATGTTTELVENAAPPTAEELDAFIAAYAEEAAAADVVVLSGSLPAGTPDSFYRDLLRRTPGRAVLDARGPELLEALACRPFLVKPNREELARTFGRDLTSEDDLIAAMREIHHRGAEWVVVTAGKEPVRVVSATGTYRLSPPETPVVNPIGCGDCLAAGIAWGLDAGRDPLDAIRLGLAAAADNLGQLLPARLDPARVGAFEKVVSISYS